MPLLEAIMGTGSNDLYDAIFYLDATPEEGLFGDCDEDDQAALMTIASSTRVRSTSRGRAPGPGPVPRMNIQSPPTSPMSPTMTGTPNLSPRVRPMTIVTTDLLEPGQSGEPSIGKMSPLARLFSGGNPIRGRTTSMGAGASLKRVETLLEEIKQLPVNKVTEEMRELQVRFICLLTMFVNAPCRRSFCAVVFAFSFTL